jgi:hypothetical protein
MLPAAGIFLKGVVRVALDAKGRLQQQRSLLLELGGGAVVLSSSGKVVGGE